MDEEESFARLLSASTPAPKPTLFADGGSSSDPWANPFGGEWGASSEIPSLPATTEPEPDQFDERPDPPSVIAAREREELAASQNAFGGGFEDPYAANPSWSPERPLAPLKSPSQSPEATPSISPVTSPSSRALPPGLIDEELLTERDARTSLTKAFIKSDAPAPATATAATPEKKGTYVFRPKVSDKPEAKPEPKQVETKPAADTNPASIPLPDSAAGTPVASRPNTPATAQSTHPATAATAATLSEPAKADRVSVSPLDTPNESDFGFRSLAIGGTGGWNGNGSAKNSPPSRFGGRGWGAIDPETPLANEGGDPWNQGSGWGEPGPLSSDQPEEEEAEVDDADDVAPLSVSTSGPSRAGGTSSPRRSKLLSTPVFQITVSDPTKVGDPVRGHVVYSVRTKTTSPHYRRGEFSVLRRFSDFLWLFEQLSNNNPGVIVPPVPDKHAFGRFQDQFIETRRAALERCLGKMAAHPILQLDPDLRLFLESDSFALDVKNRRMAPVDGTATPSSGFMASWTGPRYTEQDEWFDQRKAYLDHLEGQLKGLSKALDLASKARLEMAISVGEFAEAAQVLADSDLGAAMCAALARLADLSRKERTAGEDQAKADVGQLLNLTDEYIRFIASVRLAFAGRVKAYHIAQAAEKEVIRIRKQREKDRQAGRITDRTASMAEIAEVSYYSAKLT